MQNTGKTEDGTPAEKKTSKKYILFRDSYDKLGFSYLDLTMDELDADLESYRQLKEKKVQA